MRRNVAGLGSREADDREYDQPGQDNYRRFADKAECRFGAAIELREGGGAED